MYQKVCSVIFAIFCLGGIGLSSFVPAADYRDPLLSENPLSQSTWVDSIFNSMTFEDRLGQLFMVAAYSNKDQRHENEISKLIQEQKLGGLIFFQGGPGRQAHLTNRYQEQSAVPLFIAINAK